MERMKIMEQPREEKNGGLFLMMSLIYAVCFTIAFFKNFIGITYPLIVAVTLGVCGVFLKKSGLEWRKENFCYVAAILLLGISTALTTSGFLVFFNTVGILLLLVVLMLRQVYPKEEWSFGQFLCNILFFYICMIPQVSAPFLHLTSWIRKKKKDDRVKYPYVKPVICGILIGIPMLLFVVAMLNSADAIFAKYVGGGFRYLWKHLFFSDNMMIVIVLLMLGFFASYSFLSVLTLHNMPEWRKKESRKNPVTAITFLAMITAVYLVFCVMQLLFLFTGGFMLPEGYTYAEYAHQGFFQLPFLSIFNLVLVLLCLKLFDMNRLLKIMLTVFSGCTFILIASAALRMILYISTYHLTFLRVLVLWFLALLTFLMAGVIYQIYQEKFSLFRYGMLVVSVFYLVLSLGRPDYWIASYNVAQLGDRISYEDTAYLCGLSWDAAPALAKLHPEHEHYEENSYGEEYYGCPACELEHYFEQIQEEKLNIRTFNLSKYLAKRAME